MSYAGPNQPIAPIDDPREVYRKLYGNVQDRALLRSLMDDVRADLRRVRGRISPEDRVMLEQHETVVRELEKDLEAADRQKLRHEPPVVGADVGDPNELVPKLSRLQIDLLVNSLANDMARVATLQFTKSVGQARMRWLDVHESHHTLSHKPDKDDEAQRDLTKINRWFAGELAYLAGRLADTPEPGGDGSMLDHTTIVWTNELGQGNSHTLNNLPMVLLGKGLGFTAGRFMDLKGVAHNRLWLSVAHAMGHRLETFGNRELSSGGPLDLT
jgi:hypothetical protein